MALIIKTHQNNKKTHKFFGEGSGPINFFFFFLGGGGDHQTSIFFFFTKKKTF
jgi:hypothetical protein